MMPRKHVLMLTLCTGILAVVCAYGAPTTAPADMAMNYLRRASDEIALIDSQDERSTVLTDWIYARAAFDGPGDVDATIRLAISTFDSDQQPDKASDSGLYSAAAVRSFCLGQLAEVYAAHGNLVGARKTLAWEDLAIADIAKGDVSDLSRELARVAAVRARIGDVDGAVAALMKIERPQDRAEYAERTADVAKAAGRPNDAKIFIDLAFKIWDQVTDPQLQVLKDMARVDLLTFTGDFVGARQIIEKYPRGRFRSLGFLARKQFEAGDTTGSAKTLSDYFACKEASELENAANISDLASDLAKAGDQAGAMLCLQHAIDISSRPASPDQAKLVAKLQVAVRCYTVSVQAAMGQIDFAKKTFDSIAKFPYEEWGETLRGEITAAEIKAGRFAEAEADIFASGYDYHLIRYLAGQLARHGDFEGIESWMKSLPQPEDRAYALMGAARGLSSGPIEDLLEP